MANESQTNPLKPQELRQQALERLQHRRGKLAEMPTGDVAKLVHELEVYQVELQVQNEELQRAHLELAAALKRYQDLYDRAPVGYLTLDANLKILLANQAAAQLCFRECEELEGQTLERLVHEPERAKLWLLLRSVAGTGCQQGLDLRIERPTGGTRWVHADATLADRSAGKAGGFRLTLTDLSARVQSEEQLRQSEARLAQAIRVAGLGTFEHDHGTDALHYSPRMRQLMGLGKNDEVTLASFLEQVVPEDRKALAEAIRAAHDPAGTGLFEVEYRVGTAEGGVRWLSARSETLFEGSDKARRAVRTIGAVLDVTERKQMVEFLTKAKEQLRQHADSLEGTVCERTEQLQRTVEELEHFSYTITHDMRAPLRAMQAFGDMLMMGYAERLDTVGKDYLRRIKDAAARMDKLITDALNYSKILRFESALESVDAKALLRGLVESYQHLQPPQAEIRIDENIPSVLGNEAGLTQVFSNFLGNAVKFVPPGTTPKVRVWAEPREDYVRLWFEDNGTGIPKEYQEIIWGMFQKLDKEVEGTGVGLALVKKVAERMKGRVGVVSEPGQGSRFWIELKIYCNR